MPNLEPPFPSVLHTHSRRLMLLLRTDEINGARIPGIPSFEG
jgi:hypothetical protein